MASDFSLLEALEQKLAVGVSLSLLTQVERELLRLRSQMNQEEWKRFCSEFRYRPIFEETLRLDEVMADSFHARETMTPSPSHAMNAWEYSLPMSRSLRARKLHLAREIAEVIRISPRPRILALSAGRMLEAEDALQSGHLHHAQFVALGQEPEECAYVRKRYAACCQREQLVVADDWDSTSYDLIYAPFLLDSMEDSPAAMWLERAADRLRAGGRLLAANFAPGSRDQGWIEACWSWQPHYRSEEQLAELVMSLACPAVRGHALFRDETGVSTFLELYSL